MDKLQKLSSLTSAIFDPIQQHEPHYFALARLDMLGWRDLPVDPTERQKAIDFRNLRMAWLEVGLSGPGVGRPRQLVGGDVNVTIDPNDIDTLVFHHRMDEIAPGEAFLSHLFATHYHLFDAGFLVRGALTTGVYVEPAMSHLTYLEKNVAKWPRVVIDTLEDGTPCYLVPNTRRDWLGGDDQYYGLFARDRNGVWFFDCLRFLGMIPTGKVGDVNRPIMAKAKPLVENGLERFAPRFNASLGTKEKIEAEKTRGKYYWFAEYYNEVATQVGDEQIRLSDPRFK